MSLGRAEILIRQANRYIEARDYATARDRLREAREELRGAKGAFIELDSEAQVVKDALVRAFYEALERLPAGEDDL